mmetsp:Transcript_44298/g.139118  ORF Transcript_44298/g.139118 Transcript_44298/m.139118 type:complete len:680 (-) Transcript_44298:2655-4694(-)
MQSFYCRGYGISHFCSCGLVERTLEGCLLVKRARGHGLREHREDGSHEVSRALEGVKQRLEAAPRKAQSKALVDVEVLLVRRRVHALAPHQDALRVLAAGVMQDGGQRHELLLRRVVLAEDGRLVAGHVLCGEPEFLRTKLRRHEVHERLKGRRPRMRVRVLHDAASPGAEAVLHRVEYRAGPVLLLVHRHEGDCDLEKSHDGLPRRWDSELCCFIGIPRGRAHHADERRESSREDAGGGAVATQELGRNLRLREGGELLQEHRDRLNPSLHVEREQAVERAGVARAEGIHVHRDDVRGPRQEGVQGGAQPLPDEVLHSGAPRAVGAAGGLVVLLAGRGPVAPHGLQQQPDLLPLEERQRLGPVESTLRRVGLTRHVNHAVQEGEEDPLDELAFVHAVQRHQQVLGGLLNERGFCPQLLRLGPGRRGSKRRRIRRHHRNHRHGNPRPLAVVNDLAARSLGLRERQDLLGLRDVPVVLAAVEQHDDHPDGQELKAPVQGRDEATPKRRSRRRGLGRAATRHYLCEGRLQGFTLLLGQPLERLLHLEQDGRVFAELLHGVARVDPNLPHELIDLGRDIPVPLGRGLRGFRLRSLPLRGRTIYIHRLLAVALLGRRALQGSQEALEELITALLVPAPAEARRDVALDAVAPEIMDVVGEHLLVFLGHHGQEAPRFRQAEEVD